MALSYHAGTAPLQSVFALELTSPGAVNLTLTPDGQSLSVHRPGGGTCSTLTATSEKSQPLPARFLAADGDWRSAIDYMVDPACQVIVVRAGNRLAIVPAGQAGTFDLYGIHFILTQETAAS